MKKQLRSQIKNLAEHILSDNASNNTRKMKESARQLYEKLAVLDYLEVQLLGENESPTSDASLDSKSYRENTWFKDPEPVPQPEEREAIVEPVIEKIKDLVAQMPEESEQVEALLEEVLPKKEYYKNDLEDFASNYQEMPVFERKPNGVITNNEVKEVLETPVEEIREKEIEKTTNNTVDRPKSINETVGRGLNIGLNDRLAFVKHLFEGKTEDYTRVLSQISSFESFDAANDFIKGKVKPDYNYWLQKDEIVKRFMVIIEKSFSS